MASDYYEGFPTLIKLKHGKILALSCGVCGTNAEKDAVILLKGFAGSVSTSWMSISRIRCMRTRRIPICHASGKEAIPL
jgi:hypothetical protein